MYYFQPNQSILLREICQQKIWTARPVIVIQDAPALTVLYMVPGTTIKHPRELDSDLVPPFLLSNAWRLADKSWTGGGALYLVPPDLPYMIIGFRSDDNSHVARWYVNMQDPFRRTVLGFDYLDMELDIEIDVDLQRYSWKDEDKFHLLVSQGIIAEEKARMLRAAGEQIVQEVMDRKSIIEEWRGWSPSPDLVCPTLPEQWERVDV